MVQPIVNAPIRSPSLSLLQPVIIIGVGAIGEQVCAEIQQRQQLYQTFASPLNEAYARNIHFVTLPRIPSTGSSVTDLQDNFLAAHLVSTARMIKAAYNHSRMHAQQPFADIVRPTVYVVGATWNPTGAALLWPLAILIRCVLGYESEYRLLGVFLAADYRSDIQEQELGAAHTFSVLNQGDWLAKHLQQMNQHLSSNAGSNSPSASWLDTFKQFFPSTFPTIRTAYDQIFLLDTLKANNSTISCEDDEREVIVHSATLLEALMFTSLPEAIDTALLDDYYSAYKQQYIGVGAAALIIPLRKIAEAVEQFAIATLIRQRVLPESKPRLRDPNGPVQLINDILARITDDVQTSFNTICESPITSEILLSTGDTLYFSVRCTRAVEGLLPVVRPPSITGQAPFGFEQGFTAKEVLDLFDEENRARLQIVEEVRAGLEHNRDQCVAAIEKVYGRHISILLQSGDQGLLQAIAFLNAVIEGLDQAVANLDQQIVTANKPVQQYRAKVEGAQHWFYKRHIVQPSIELRPQVSAITLRSAMLLILLFSFFLEGAFHGSVYWPFNRLNFLLPAGASTLEAWRLPLFVILLVVVALGTAFLAGIPIAAVNQLFRAHRRSVAHLLEMELQQIIREEVKEYVAQVHTQLLQTHLPQLTALRDQLNKYAEQLMSTAIDEEPDTYGEHVVASLQEIVFPYQQQAAAQALRYVGHCVPSWQPARPVNLWDVCTALDVMQSIRSKVQLAVARLVIQPIEKFLPPNTHEEWLYKLWKSSTPWIKADLSSTNGKEILELNALMTNGGQGSNFANVVQRKTDYCHVLHWDDPFRILFLRLLCGIDTDYLTRRVELQQAFQFQPTDSQHQISGDPALLSRYPSLITDAQRPLVTFKSSSEAISGNNGNGTNPISSADDGTTFKVGNIVGVGTDNQTPPVHTGVPLSTPKEDERPKPPVIIKTPPEDEPIRQSPEQPLGHALFTPATDESQNVDEDMWLNSELVDDANVYTDQDMAEIETIAAMTGADTEVNALASMAVSSSTAMIVAAPVQGLDQPQPFAAQSSGSSLFIEEDLANLERQISSGSLEEAPAPLSSIGATPSGIAPSNSQNELTLEEAELEMMIMGDLVESPLQQGALEEDSAPDRPVSGNPAVAELDRGALAVDAMVYDVPSDSPNQAPQSTEVGEPAITPHLSLTLDSTGVELRQILDSFRQASRHINRSYAEILDKALDTIQALVKGTDNQTFTRVSFLNVFRELDICFTMVDAPTKQILSFPYAQFDRFLDQLDIQPFIPVVGESYNVHIHGEAMVQPTKSSAEIGRILRVLRRGYREKSTGLLLMAPLVIIGVAHAQTSKESEL